MRVCMLNNGILFTQKKKKMLSVQYDAAVQVYNLIDREFDDQQMILYPK